MNNTVLNSQKSSGGLTSPKEKEGKKRWLTRKLTGSGSGSSTPKSGAEDDSETEGMRVDFYLVVFLKFIASIVPTIEVDSTTSF